MRGLITKSIILCFFFTFVLVRPAYGYIDPGTGSMILQGILAAVMAAALFIKLSWRKIRAFFGIKGDNDSQEDEFEIEKNTKD